MNNYTVVYYYQAIAGGPWTLAVQHAQAVDLATAVANVQASVMLAAVAFWYVLGGLFNPPPASAYVPTAQNPTPTVNPVPIGTI